MEGPAPRNPVGWFEIYVNDMAAARAFYESVFDVCLQAMPLEIPGLEFWAFPRGEGGGISGALAKKEGFERQNNSVIIYFHCQDCLETEEKVRTAGGFVQMSKIAVPRVGFISLVGDMERNMIGLFSLQ